MPDICIFTVTGNLQRGSTITMWKEVSGDENATFLAFGKSIKKWLQTLCAKALALLLYYNCAVEEESSLTKTHKLAIGQD